FTFPGVASIAGSPLAASPGALFFLACDGSSTPYELDVAASYNATFTDLSNPGSRVFLNGSAAGSYLISGAAQQWKVAPRTSMIPGAVLSAASFTNRVAPGGLISILGAGLSGSGRTTVQINGANARVIVATPSQVNAQIPTAAAPGSAQLSV